MVAPAKVEFTWAQYNKIIARHCAYKILRNCKYKFRALKVIIIKQQNKILRTVPKGKLWYGTEQNLNRKVSKFSIKVYLLYRKYKLYVNTVCTLYLPIVGLPLFFT